MIGYLHKIILYKSKTKTKEIRDFINNKIIFFLRIPVGKPTRRATAGGPTPDITELTVPNNVLTKFRKSCAAYCTAGFVIGLGKFFLEIN
jgi:hypothetical protein